MSFFRQINDKVLHFACSFCIEILLAVTLPTWFPWARFSFNVLIVGGGKELYDMIHSDTHDADIKDLFADAAGAIAAEIIIALLR